MPFIRRKNPQAAMTNDTFYTWKSRLGQWGHKIGLEDAKSGKPYRATDDLVRQFNRVDGRVVPIEWGNFEDMAYIEFIRGYDSGFSTSIRHVYSYPTSNKKTAEETARMLHRQGFENVETKKEKAYPYQGASKQVTMYTVTALTDKRTALPYGIREGVV